jgi:hypothetical protein
MPSSLQRNTDILRQQAAGGYGIAGKYDAPAPSAAMYGVFGPAYASILARPEQSASLNAGNRLTAMLESRNEAERYEQALRDAQANQLEGVKLQGFNDLQMSVADNAVEAAKNGMAGGYGVFMGENGAEFQTDPVLGYSANQMFYNREGADVRHKNSESNKNNYESGIPVDPALAAARDRHPLNPNPATPYAVFPDRFKPSDYTDRLGIPIDQQNADSERIRANAALLDAENGGGPEVTAHHSPGGVVSYDVKGSPAAVASYSPSGEVESTKPADALTQRIALARQKGYEMAPDNGYLKVTDPKSGQTAYYDENGTFVGNVRPGGAQEQ